MAEAVRQLRPAITLDALDADPSRIAELGEAQVAILLSRSMAVTAALQARIMYSAVLDAADARSHERILSIEDVARRLGRSSRWVEDHIDDLPDRRELADGSPGWRERDLDEWIRTRPSYVMRRRS